MQSIFLILIFLLLALFHKPCFALTFAEAEKLAINNNDKIQAELALLPVVEAEMIIAKYRSNSSFRTAHELVTGGAIQPVQISLPIEIGKRDFIEKSLQKRKLKRKK